MTTRRSTPSRSHPPSSSGDRRIPVPVQTENYIVRACEGEPDRERHIHCTSGGSPFGSVCAPRLAFFAAGIEWTVLGGVGLVKGQVKAVLSFRQFRKDKPTGFPFIPCDPAGFCKKISIKICICAVLGEGGKFCLSYKKAVDLSGVC